MYNYPYYSYSPFHFFGSVISTLIWILIAIAILKIIKHAKRHDSSDWQGFVGRNWGKRNALDILKERYAKGEINKEEFDSKKKDLA